ncbi:MAG: hypothetical protein IMZ57_04205 [Acidobacteria bacterium]|nr:hypothetical protein [Acidobacteriota bacterium]
MSMINAYCVDDLIIVKWGSNDAWGEPTWASSGSASDLNCKGYIVWKTQLVRDFKGEEVTSSVMIYLPKKIEKPKCLGRRLMHEDRIWLPNEPIDRAIVAIVEPKDFSHPHYEIYLA